MWSAIKELLKSKKFLATAVGIVVSVLAGLGVPIPEATVKELLTLIVAFVVGQGIADHGKSAAIVATKAAIAAAAKELEPKP